MSAILEVRWRPILFSAAMVRAILAGTKTQTRRVLRIPEWFRDEYPARFGAYELRMELDCPYGVPGDRLWVKEAVRRDGGGPFSVYIADGAPTVADAWPWKNKALPGMYCPRGLSRITLEVTDVRVQRLQDVSGDDARAEGVAYPVSIRDCPPGKCAPLFRVDMIERAASWGILSTAAKQAEREPTHDDMSRLYFSALWDEINGKRSGCSWDANPWCWAVSFKRIEDRP